MTYENKDKLDKRRYENLKNDCKKCFGFCCVALYFSASDGFPNNKEAGRPCIHLKQDFSCAIHNSLIDKGLRGCIAYDCFGAGQKVAQVTYNGKNWREVPESAQQMFEVFYVMKQLHEMLWYLTGALFIKVSSNVKDDLKRLISETESLTYLKANSLLELDIISHRDKVNDLLQKISKLVRAEVSKDKKNTLSFTKKIAGRLDLIGADLRNVNLRGVDLGGALLIAADLRENNLKSTNLIGADLRDTNIKGANLADSLFITQSQVNTAKGDSNTRLPVWIERPRNW